jgi:hypothetical protein
MMAPIPGSSPAAAAGLAAALLVGLAVPVVALAQPEAYLNNVPPADRNLTGISGRWVMQGHIGSTNPPRMRVAKTEDGKLPPLLPGPAALLEQRLVDAENGKVFANMGAYCMPQGIPLMLFAAVEGPIQIFETPGQVTIVSQEFNEVWFTYLNEKHAAKVDPSWHGDSVSRWEGDTLVIDTIGLTDRTTIDHMGMPHSEKLHVVTRLRRLDKDTMEVRATMDDPQTFSAPWTRRFLYKRPAPGARVDEQVCENQRNGVNADGQSTFLTYEEILAGKTLENAK